jgi:hypothetical protein
MASSCFQLVDSAGHVHSLAHQWIDPARLLCPTKTSCESESSETLRVNQLAYYHLSASSFVTQPIPHA